MPQALRTHQIKLIIEFHLKGHGIREIERLCGISRNTIRDYLRKLQQDGRLLSDRLNLENQALLSIVQTDRWVRELPK